MAKKATPKKTPATKAAPKKAAPKRKALAAKKVAPKKAVAKKAVAKKAAPKKAAPKKAVAKKAAPKKAVAKKAAAPKKAVAKKAAAPKKAVAKKAAAPKKAVAKKAAAPKVTRRDHAGHIDPSYARDLLAKSGGRDVDGDDGAFLGKKKRGKDPLADELGKEFVETVTSGEDEGIEIRDGKQVEELGGPFIRTNASQEFAYDPDASNPKGARREPFPKT